MADLSVSGLASGFDWKSLVAQLVDVERAPERRLTADQNRLQQKNNAYGSINTQLNVLRNRVTALKDPAFFSTRLTSTGDATTATATATTEAALGSYTFDFTQLATAAAQQGVANAGKALSATNDVAGLVLSSAGFNTAVTAGTFSVNGKTVTLATTDTLQQVFDKISTATGGAVTGTYDAASDKISLAGTGTVVLGSATDTSNFLQVAKLNNNGGATVTSTAALGSVKLAGSMSAANLTTTVNDGGAGKGQFKINGVAIDFSVGDSVSAVLKRINDSAAGVSATYDSVNDRFAITNKSTGDVGISLEDVTGNFLAATKLSTGSLQRGKNLLYTINGGGQLVSQSNTVTESTSGLAGLQVTALKLASTTVQVSSDTATIKKAINDFLTEYNKAESLIDSQTASSTDAKGKVTAGLLAADGDAEEISSSLRHKLTGEISGLAGTLKQLAGLGIDSNGNDNTLTLANSAKLDDALANNLSSVKDFFTNTTSGLATTLDGYLEHTIGDDGTLTKHRTSLTKQAGDIDTQIADMERRVLNTQQQLTASFVAMETAQAKTTQQLQYLQKSFPA